MLAEKQGEMFSIRLAVLVATRQSKGIEGRTSSRGDDSENEGCILPKMPAATTGPNPSFDLHSVPFSRTVAQADKLLKLCLILLGRWSIEQGKLYYFQCFLNVNE